MSIAHQTFSHYICTHTHTDTHTHIYISVCMMLLRDQGNSAKKLFFAATESTNNVLTCL